MAWTPSQLEAAYSEGDVLADSTVEQIVDERGRRGAMELFLRLIEEDGLPDDAHVDRYVRAAAVMPRWARPELLDSGERFFEEYGWTIFTLLGCASLPEGYVVPEIDLVLASTLELEQHVQRRLWETIQFTLDVMQPGGLDIEHPESSTGVRSALKVRLLHALIRYSVEHEPLPTTRARTLPDVLLDRSAPPSGHRAINQAQMAGTILAFSYVVLRGLDTLGYAGIDESAREAYLHRWNVVGHLMGVRDDLTAATMDGARALFNAIRDPRMAQSADGIALAGALIAFMEGHIPRWVPMLRPLPRLLIVELCDARTIELLDVRLSRIERASVEPLLRVMQWWGGSEQRALRSSTHLQAGTRWLFRRTSRHLLRAPRGGKRGDFTIAPELAQRWGVKMP